MSILKKVSYALGAVFAAFALAAVALYVAYEATLFKPRQDARRDIVIRGGTLFDATHLNWAFPAKLLREDASRAKLAPFRLYGPTCDSMDAAAGPFMLPADVREGDLVVTSGLGDRFPGGYPVAVVEHVNRSEGQTFAAVEARPLAALDRGKEVLLIRTVIPEPSKPEPAQQ